jgi:hypothetical protein
MSTIAVKRRRHSLRWYRFAAIRTYYTLRGRRPIGGTDGLPPKLGRGKYVDVLKRGPFLEITRHHRALESDITAQTIRLVPYAPNHGVMVELWQDGRCRWRTHCDFDAFKARGFGEHG